MARPAEVIRSAGAVSPDPVLQSLTRAVEYCARRLTELSPTCSEANLLRDKFHAEAGRLSLVLSLELLRNSVRTAMPEAPSEPSAAALEELWGKTFAAVMSEGAKALSSLLEAIQRWCAMKSPSCYENAEGLKRTDTLGYHMGVATQAYDLATEAMATFTGEALDALRERIIPGSASIHRRRSS